MQLLVSSLFWTLNNLNPVRTNRSFESVLCYESDKQIYKSIILPFVMQCVNTRDMTFENDSN